MNLIHPYSRPGAIQTTPWLKKPKFHPWHQSLSHMFFRWVLLFFSSFFSATEEIEETHHLCSCPFNSALKFFLIVLWLVNIITADLGNQKWVIIREPNQSRESLASTSYFPVGWIWLAYRAISCPQKRVTYNLRAFTLFLNNFLTGFRSANFLMLQCSFS